MIENLDNPIEEPYFEAPVVSITQRRRTDIRVQGLMHSQDQEVVDGVDNSGGLNKGNVLAPALSNLIRIDFVNCDIID